MKIGIYGGTFDPVHLAHLVLAEQCRDQLKLDEVWFIPAATPPHKVGVTIAPAKQRLEMLELALSGHPSFRICKRELERSGPSYTVDTLRDLHTEFPEHEWFLLLGGDSVNDFSKWRAPDEIAALAKLVAVNRGSQPLEPNEREFLHVQMPALDISGSNLRARLQSHQSIRYLVPRAVEEYLRQNKLYQTDGQQQGS